HRTTRASCGPCRGCAACAGSTTISPCSRSRTARSCTDAACGGRASPRLPLQSLCIECARAQGSVERTSRMAQPKRAVWRLQVGEEAPDFELTATGDGAGKGGPQKKVRLSDYRGKKNVVLAFYPAAFTPV